MIFDLYNVMVDFSGWLRTYCSLCEKKFVEIFNAIVVINTLSCST